MSHLTHTHIASANIGRRDTPPSKPKDEKKSGTAKRFFGDTLVGRFASTYALLVWLARPSSVMHEPTEYPER